MIIVAVQVRRTHSIAGRFIRCGEEIILNVKNRDNQLFQEEILCKLLINRMLCILLFISIASLILVMYVTRFISLPIQKCVNLRAEE